MDRRDPQHQAPRVNGRRASDPQGWSTERLAGAIGMSSDFVLGEIKAGELRASLFGRVYRIHVDEVRRYVQAKGWPPPADI